MESAPCSQGSTLFLRRLRQPVGTSNARAGRICCFALTVLLNISSLALTHLHASCLDLARLRGALLPRPPVPCLVNPLSHRPTTRQRYWFAAQRAGEAALLVGQSGRGARQPKHGQSVDTNNSNPSSNGRPAKRMGRRASSTTATTTNGRTTTMKTKTTRAVVGPTAPTEPPAARAKPAFQPGAIVRVTLNNFGTYEHAEFDPGPSLNLVIGPNATDKTSLVRAICLGLGFDPNVLGRTTTCADFVQQGHTHAIVEIELQAPTNDMCNHIVRLRINREDNSRTFWLNGQEARLPRVQALMAELHIQVDNWCQFLLQDRVAEFADLNSVDLLAKTLEAAASLDMRAIQVSLRNTFHAHRDAKQQIQIIVERLHMLKSQHQTQEIDEERFREREKIQRAIDDLEDEATSDVMGPQAQSVHLTTLHAEKQVHATIVVGLLQDQEQSCEAVLAATEEITREGNERELYALAQTRTIDSLQYEVAAEKAKLELTRTVDEAVLDEYQRRGAEIQQLRASLATHTSAFEDASAKCADLRSRWEPWLDELIGRINNAFSYNLEQINCAGEIIVHKAEDFDKWAIDIRVKFRENEELQRLDRQSGDERAVSTIFYLLSLQAMAQAPFRVVDEISQGMDPRNECMVHERMVEIACHEHRSQYFLITPKLLPNFRYDEKMNVLCITSGPYGPNDKAKLDFRECIEVQRRRLAGAS